MKRSADALVRADADVEGMVRDVVPPPTVHTYRVVTLTKTVHGCVGVTTVRIRQPNGQTTDVQGFTLPDALRRLASLVDREQGHTDVRVAARAALVELATEANRLSNVARYWSRLAEQRKSGATAAERVAERELVVHHFGMQAGPDASWAQRDEVRAVAQAVLVRIRDELALDDALAPPDDETGEETPL